MARITITVPDKTLADLDNLASHLGVCRSALVAVILDDGLVNLHPVFDHISGGEGDYPPLRMRGRSEYEIRELLGPYLSLGGSR